MYNFYEIAKRVNQSRFVFAQAYVNTPNKSELQKAEEIDELFEKILVFCDSEDILTVRIYWTLLSIALIEFGLEPISSPAV